MVQVDEGRFLVSKKLLPPGKDIIPPIPQETTAAARSVLEKENFYLATGDELSHLLSNIPLRSPPTWKEQSAHNLAIFYLMTIFQFMECLPDPLAVEAFQMRVDWKYAFHLPLSSPAWPFNGLCEFRQWLLADWEGRQTLDLLLAGLSEVAQLSGKGSLNLKGEEVLQGVCLFTRLYMVGSSIQSVLKVITTSQPGWLRSGHVMHCYSLYSGGWQSISQCEKSEAKAAAQTIGMNGHYLLRIIAETGTSSLADQPEVLAMRSLWADQYEWVNGRLQWKKDHCASCALPGMRQASFEVFTPKE